jgi:membrane protease YdiL (CAAX protease family)
MATAALAVAPRQQLRFSSQTMLGGLCLTAGIAAFAAPWISPDLATRTAYGLILSVIYLAVTLFVRSVAALQPYWELSFAFFILACSRFLNSVVDLVGTAVLHDPPHAGDPLASTLSGTVVVQLLGTVVAIAPVLLSTLVTGRGLGSIYATKGKLGGWFVFAVVFLVAFYVFLATLPLRPGSPATHLLPTNGPLTLARFLGLTPALLVVSLSNGFEEEVLARGLFLQKYEPFFGVRTSNVLQAIVFSAAHAEVTYTPSLLLFLVVCIFPLGLFAGFLMRTTNGVLTPGIFHGALDMGIYLAFLTYAT